MLDVHLGQSLLHVMRCELHQHRPLTKIIPQSPYLRVGLERTRQQTIGVKLLQPLAVQHVGLMTGHALQPSRVHQRHLEPALFKDSEQHYPVHALDSIATVLTLHSRSQSAILYNSAVYASNSRIGASFRHVHVVTTRSHVYVRSVQVHPRQPVRQSLRSFSSVLLGPSISLSTTMQWACRRRVPHTSHSLSNGSVSQRDITNDAVVRHPGHALYRARRTNAEAGLLDDDTPHCNHT